MAHDVFICHASQDKTVADAVCATLEGMGMRCWIAPRDVLPGSTWAASINDAIKGSRVMVFVHSAGSNGSEQCLRELERAVNHGASIVPLRIEDVAPSSAIEYFIGASHWLDAMTPPVEAHLDRLGRAVRSLLAVDGSESTGPSRVAALPTGPPRRPAWKVALGVSVLVLGGAAVAFAVLGGGTSEEASLPLGARIYRDRCARCHGRDGKGAREGEWYPVPPLRDSLRFALAESPVDLLVKVVQGAEGTEMPAWGERLSVDEIVAVVNHVRTAWEHDASTIELRHRRTPAEIERVDRVYERAIRDKDAQTLTLAMSKARRRPRLFRSDGTRARGREDVRDAWQHYFVALGPARRPTSIDLVERRFDFEERTMAQDGAVVIGTGRMFVEVEASDGVQREEQGAFVRIYQRGYDGWSLVYDFADLPFAVGVDLPVPEGADAAPALPPVGSGFADVVAILRGLGKGAGDAPHENFWSLAYDDFVRFEFAQSWVDVSVMDNRVRLVVPWDPESSNLLRALEGRPLLVERPDGKTVEAEVPRMPKNGPYLTAEQIATIRKWIEAGCPEEAGEASPWPKPER